MFALASVIVGCSHHGALHITVKHFIVQVSWDESESPSCKSRVYIEIFEYMMITSTFKRVQKIFRPNLSMNV